MCPFHVKCHYKFQALLHWITPCKPHCKYKEPFGGSHSDILSCSTCRTLRIESNSTLNWSISAAFEQSCLFHLACICDDDKQLMLWLRGGGHHLHSYEMPLIWQVICLLSYSPPPKAQRSIQTKSNCYVSLGMHSLSFKDSFAYTAVPPSNTQFMHNGDCHCTACFWRAKSHDSKPKLSMTEEFYGWQWKCLTVNFLVDPTDEMCTL